MNSPPTGGEEWMTSRQVADYLNVHPRTVQRLARDGTLPSHWLGKRLRFRLADVDSLLDPDGYSDQDDDDSEGKTE